MFYEDEMEVTQVTTEPDMVDSVENAGIREGGATDEIGDEEPTELIHLGSFQGQLASIARVNCIVGARQGEDSKFFRSLRNLQGAPSVEEGLTI